MGRVGNPRRMAPVALFARVASSNLLFAATCKRCKTQAVTLQLQQKHWRPAQCALHRRTLPPRPGRVELGAWC